MRLLLGSVIVACSLFSVQALAVTCKASLQQWGDDRGFISFFGYGWNRVDACRDAWRRCEWYRNSYSFHMSHMRCVVVGSEIEPIFPVPRPYPYPGPIEPFDM